jgi:xanthine dehydrogenase accessory factor
VSTAGRSDSFQPITALQWIFGELSTAPKQIEESAVRELLDDLDRWRTQGKRVAIARVVDIEGSGPREPGAAMAVSEDGVVAGSVSGGCVEGAVVEAALDSLRTGERRVHTFGFSDTDAFAVGLTCGGIIHLFVEPLDW